MKYVVVPARGEEDPVWFHEVRPPVLCGSREEAEAVIAEINAREDGEWEWAVYEVVDGRCERRSVVGSSGRPEIQPGGA